MIGAAACLPFLQACRSQAALNPQGEIPAQLSADKIEKAILSGCAARRWVASVKAPGHILAIFTKGQHVAAVDIRYNNSEYQITKNERTTLLRGEDSVHSHYNKWVRNLDAAIRTQLARSVL
jgi:hypothetical protein